MPQIHKTKGKCVRCGQIITSAIACSHILGCYGLQSDSSVTPKAVSAKGSTAKTAPSTSKATPSAPKAVPVGGLPGFLIRVGYAYKPELYWMFIRVPKTKRLKHLDGYLRSIWLECCGHGSQFSINGRDYVSFNDYSDSESGKLSKPLENVLTPGTVFTHLYDFGTSTQLVLQVIQEMPCPEDSIELLMRNVAPAYKCSCKKPATTECTQCGVHLCSKCSHRHPCAVDDDYMLSPIANSPRSGVCGYTDSEHDAFQDDDDDDDDDEEDEDE